MTVGLKWNPEKVRIRTDIAQKYLLLKNNRTIMGPTTESCRHYLLSGIFTVWSLPKGQRKRRSKRPPHDHQPQKNPKSGQFMNEEKAKMSRSIFRESEMNHFFQTRFMHSHLCRHDFKRVQGHEPFQRKAFSASRLKIRSRAVLIELSYFGMCNH